jgi:glucose/arabinose dehydrogenase
VQQNRHNHPFAVNLCLASVLLVALSACKTDKPDALVDYQTYCASCHSADLSGGMGASLVSGQWLENAKSADLARVIREGSPEAGMPGFGGVLTNERINTLVELIQMRTAARRFGVQHKLDATIEAETYDPGRSVGIQVETSQADPTLTYVGYFDSGKSMCYEQVDLTGVRSLELVYAKSSDLGRFAVLAYAEGDSSPVNLGEQSTRETGGWETFQRLRVGLSEQLEGAHWLCFMGLQGAGILNLDSFSLSAEVGSNEGTGQEFKVANKVLSALMTRDVFTAGGYDFRLEAVADAPGILWAMDFLPDGTLVASQRDGRLWLFSGGERLGAIQGTPEVFHRGQGGLLDVKVHPQYRDNGWLYLTFADPAKDGTSAMTRVVRGKLEGLSWVNEETLYMAPADFYTNTDYHFGSRLIFKDGYIYFSIGDRGQPEQAQNLAYPNGKVHRLHEDGRIPKDNPFVGDPQALASIWSYGHRNPQGMALHPNTGALWAAEHGPRGGDEINFLGAGLNYGWPLVTYGINYDGTSISDLTHKEGMESPKHQWTPSIAVSGIRIYDGDRFPAWRGQLLVGSLAAQQLRLVRLEGDTVVGDDVLLENLGRIRDVSVGPDGYPYVVFNNPNGVIYRLLPGAMASLGAPLPETDDLRTPESLSVP